MKIYVSFPMTQAHVEDRQLADAVIHILRGRGIEHYDPRTEPLDQSMEEIQVWDFDQMSCCIGLLCVWSESAPTSGGMMAEIEWARRIFGQRIAIYRPNPNVPISAWTKESARGKIFQQLDQALEELGILSEFKAKEPAHV